MRLRFDNRILWTLFPFIFVGCAMASVTQYTRVNEKKLINGNTLSEFRLPNGARVILVPRHQAKVVTFQTWFQVGSLQEKLDPKLNKTGLAHLFEHMMFRGSEKYPDGKFDEITSRMGADKQNATTHFYRTNYYESVPSHQLEPLMELESDRMKNLRLHTELLEKEKGAVVGELRRHLDSPASVGMDDLLRSVYETEPYRWTVLGTEEEIKGFTTDEAQYFYKTFYAPNNSTLIVVGDVNEEALMPKVLKYYGDMKSQTIPSFQFPPEKPQTKARNFERKHAQATSETLLVAYRIPPVDSPDAVPLSLLGTHLSRGMESRLRKVLVDKGIAVSAYGNAQARPDIFEFFIQLSEGQPADKALKIIDTEIASLQQKRISKEAFERALNQELLMLYDEISDNSRLGSLLGEYLMLCGNYMRGFEIIEAFRKIDSADIQRVAKAHFNRNQRSIVVVKPDRVRQKDGA